jgi:ribosomal protein L14
MIQPLAYVNPGAKIGARLVECITVCKTRGRQPGSFGDFAVVSVKKLRKKVELK